MIVALFLSHKYKYNCCYLCCLLMLLLPLMLMLQYKVEALAALETLTPAEGRTVFFPQLSVSKDTLQI